MMARDSDPTLREIRARFEEAADTLRRLPMPREVGRLSSLAAAMPECVRTVEEAYGYTDAEPPRIPPSASAIDRLDEVLNWLRWLPEIDGRLVWMRAMRLGWKRVSEEFRCDRTTAWRRWTMAVMTIAARRSAMAA